VIAPANQAEAIERAKELAPLLADIMSTGIVSACGIASELSVRGVKGRWRANSVSALLDRLPELRANAALDTFGINPPMNSGGCLRRSRDRGSFTISAATFALAHYFP
jgi:hypothetical protein